MSILSPPVAGPPYEDIADRTEKLAEAYTGWTPPPPGEMDAGRALIRVFERMTRHVIERINRMPDRSFLAFLDRVGVEAAPPRAARVPLTFSLVAKGEAEPVVPAGTRVGAAAAPGDTREVVFETEVDLPTTRARLMAAIVQQPNGDRIADVTAAATGLRPAYYPAFDGGAPAPHAFYLAADDVLGLAAGTKVTVAFTLETPAEELHWRAMHDVAALPLLSDDHYYYTSPPMPPLVRWTYWNGTDWSRIEPQILSDTSFTFLLPGDMAAVAVNGKSARWLRADLLGWPADPIPKIQGVTISAVLTTPDRSPDIALSNGRPVDLSIDFYPLGEQPRLNDMFYLACGGILSRPGTKATLTITRSDNAAHLTESDAPQLAWEMSTSSGSGWTKVISTSPSPPLEEGAPILNDALRTKDIVVPADVAVASVGGTKACWLRIRLAGGSYGKGVIVPVTSDSALFRAINDGHRPPILSGIKLSGTVTISNSSPSCIVLDDFELVDRTGQWPVLPFTRSTAEGPAIYLGFDRPFAPQDVLLYVQVAPLAPDDAARDATTGSGPRVVWEYARGTTWAALACEDDTRGFATSGLVRFIGPRDLTRRSELGQTLYWLRARLSPEVTVDAAAAVTRLGFLLTNTVWASDALHITNEVLGSGDGRADQSSPLAASPVLADEQIEVDEGTEPPPAERAAIEALEGPDAITIVGDPLRPDQVWVRWHQVPDFFASGPRDRCYVLDRPRNRVIFGDGQRGLPPPRGTSNVRAARYRAGGGAAGNRDARTVAQLKTTVPYVDGVVNHEPAMSGADQESLSRVKERGPRVLRHGHRAVAAEDFEDLALEASPDVARARVITPKFDAIELSDTPGELPPVKTGVPAPGGVVLLLVTARPELPPAPSVGLLREVEAHVRARAAPAVALRVAGPSWIKVSVGHLAVIASSPVGLEATRDRIARALTAFFHPITGGFDGTGWDFGELPYASDVYRLVTSVPGVDRVGALQLDKDPAPPASDDPALARVMIYPGEHRIEVHAQQELGRS